MSKYNRLAALSVAREAVKCGYMVALANDGQGTYGLVSDNNGVNVLYFQGDLGLISFSGRYSSARDGTGWRISSEVWDVKVGLKEALKQCKTVPRWASTSATLLTFEQAMKHGKHSKYKLMTSHEIEALYVEVEGLV